MLRSNTDLLRVVSMSVVFALGSLLPRCRGSLLVSVGSAAPTMTVRRLPVSRRRWRRMAGSILIDGRHISYKELKPSLMTPMAPV